MTTQDKDAIARAKADIADFDRKINMIATEENRLERQRRQMEGQRERIRAFVEMYDRYTGGAGAASAQENATVAPNVERKPDGIPPMTEMIVAALKAAAQNGRKGLEPRDMTEFIRQKWWPGVKSESVGPIAWRMSRLGQLKKKGSVYMLPAG